MHRIACKLFFQSRLNLLSKRFSSSYTAESPLPKDRTKPQVVYFKETLETSGAMPTVDEVIEENATNPPLVEELFLGRVSPTLLLFPQLDSNSAVCNLERRSALIERYLLKDEEKLHLLPDIAGNNVNSCSQLKLWAIGAPQVIGGLGVKGTAVIRLTEGIAASNPSLSQSLSVHETWGVRALLLAGSDIQREKYVQKLVSGEIMVGCALVDSGNGCTAKWCSKSSSYHLFGQKVISEASKQADIFAVLVSKILSGEQLDEMPTVFLVHRKDVTVDGRLMTFENARGDLLGELGEGYRLAEDLLQSARLRFGAQATVWLRQLLTFATEQATRQGLLDSTSATAADHLRLGEAAANCYAIESVTYMISGIADQYDAPQLGMECAAVQLIAAELLWRSATSLSRFIDMGVDSSMKKLFYLAHLALIHSDAEFQSTAQLRMCFALRGMQFAFTRLSRSYKREKSVRPGLITDEGARVYDELHPNLKRCAEDVQLELERLAKMLPKHFLSDNIPTSEMQSGNIVRRHIVVRVCDIILDTLASLASMSRASRAKSIGLRHHDHELDLARSFTMEALKRIRLNLSHMDIEKRNTCIISDHARIAKELQSRQGYRISHHPLACNDI